MKNSRYARAVFLLGSLLIPLLVLACSTAWGADASANNQGATVVSQDGDRGVMEGFRRDEIVLGKAVKIGDQRKHTILFIMGVTLLVLIITTAYFGISMVLNGKQLFVPHMIAAGLTVTLAVAHAIVSMVWFFPF